MIDTVNVVVVDCSLETPPPDGFTDRLRENALELLVSHEPGAAEKARLVMLEAARLDTLGPVDEHRQATDDETADIAAAQEELAQHSAADEQLAEHRSTLLSKLAAGKGSPTDVQSALAMLLGGTTTDS